MRRIAPIVFAALLALLAGCGGAGSTKETPLGDFSTGTFASALTVSPDGAHIAFIRKNGAKQVVVRDGLAGQEYDQIPGTLPLEYSDLRDFAAQNWGGEPDQGPNLLFSPDGSRLACAAKKGGRMIAVVDGEEGKPYDAIFSFLWSDDSKHLAYGAKRSGSRVMVVDGVEQILCDKICDPTFPAGAQGPSYVGIRRDKVIVVENGAVAAEHPLAKGWTLFMLSPDCRHLACIAPPSGGKKDASGSSEFSGSQLAGYGHAAFLDGAEGRAYDRIDGFVFSPDSKRLAYSGWSEKRKMCFLSVDGKEFKGYDRVSEMTFSPDSRHFACLLYKDSSRIEAEWKKKMSRSELPQWFPSRYLILFDGIEQKEYEYLDGAPVFSPDGAHVAYHVRHDTRDFVVLDTVEQAKFPRASSPWFLADGRMMYVADTGMGKKVIVDGVEQDTYDEVGPMLDTPDRTSYIYIGRKGGKLSVVKEGVRLSSFGSLKGGVTNVTGLQLSPDQARLAVIVERGGYKSTVVDGVEHRKYVWIRDACFSPTGKRFAYIGFRDGLYFLVVDGKEVRQKHTSVSEFAFHGDDFLHAVVSEKMEYFLLEVKF